MDVYREANNNPMDYGVETKQGKMLFPCQEERFDSGLDSLKEDELASDMADLKVRPYEPAAEDNEPWRSAVTDDGDT